MWVGSLCTEDDCSDSEIDLMIKKTLIIACLAALSLTLLGCNTIHGVGQDLEAVGEGIQEATE